MKKSCRTFYLVVLLTAVLAAVFTTYGVKSSDAFALNYYYFESPSAIAVDADSLYVVDDNELKAFSLSGGVLYKTKTLLAANATMAYATNGKVYTVENGNIYIYDFLDEVSDSLLLNNGAYSGVYVDENYIYASRGNEVIVFDILTLSQVKIMFGTNGEIKGFSVLGELVYAVTYLSPYRSNVLVQSINSNSSSFALENIAINGITTLNDSETVVLLHNTYIAYYKSRGLDALYETARFSIDDLVTLSANEKVYALSGAKSIIEFDKSLTYSNEFLAYSSNSPGFYDNPTDITTRFGKVYIADKGNNRVAVRDNDTFFSLPSIIRPVAVTVDGNGDVVVAHSENKLATFDGARNILLFNDEVKVQDANELKSLSSSIADIKFDARENLFLLTNSFELYVKKASLNSFNLIASDAFDSIYAIDASASGLDIFLLAKKNGQAKVIKLGINADEAIEVLTLSIDATNAIDIAADADGGIYLLKPQNHIQRYSYENNTYAMEYSKQLLSELNINKITVSAIDSDFVKFRELIVLDSDKNALKMIDHEFLGVNYVKTDEAEKLPSSYKSTIALSIPIVRTIIREGGANIYAQSSEVSPLSFVLPQGFKVLVPEFNPTAKFTRVICDNTTSSESELIVGYVNTSHISEAESYLPSPTMYCRVWLHDIAVYSLPSRQAPIIEGFESLEKGITLELIEFIHSNTGDTSAYGYIDNFTSPLSNTWYRVRVVSGNVAYEGFVYASGVSLSNSTPDTSLRPQANAEIIAKKGESADMGVPIYYYDENSKSYILDMSYGNIKVGTKVEVVGAFDPNEKYTKILFYYSNFGTVEVFVETENIKYYGVSVMQIIAVIIIVLVALLIGFLIVRQIRKQQKNKIKI